MSDRIVGNPEVIETGSGQSVPGSRLLTSNLTLTASNLDHSLGSGDGPDVGKSKPNLHRKEDFPELVARDLVVRLLDASLVNARSIGGVPCMVKLHMIQCHST